MTTLGPVTREQLRVLYQRALALVFPSLYEGFGLPPLEAMAAGTPVIAMPISAVPEVGGDAVLYPDGLSVAALARAMESIALDESLCDAFRRTRQAAGRRVSLGADRSRHRGSLSIGRHATLGAVAPDAAALAGAIIRWSETRPAEAWLDCYNDSDLFMMNYPVGIKNAFRALNVSLKARLRRELKRLRPASRRRSA